VAEVLRNFNKAESLYVRSSQLLQILTMDASHPSDKAVLESCTPALHTTHQASLMASVLLWSLRV
jgi:hypothetical protein